jgi:hypothetical protein
MWNIRDKDLKYLRVKGEYLDMLVETSQDLEGSQKNEEKNKDIL